ncbi:MAG: peptidoglycan bridge formation glycyltransferase FemA/FemB family protein [Clostridia bacterium]|nr:peptidoglycan bridge formation glycyltransferase FemA/FemB family protein [Clostridia bacterium]
MDYKAYLIEKKDKDKFNSFLSRSEKGHIFQSYEWGEVKARTGWVPLRLVVEREGEIIAAVSILERTVPFLKRKIFYAPRGPVLDYKDRELFDFLLAEIRKLAQRRKAFMLKIDPDIPSSDKELADYLASRGFRLQEKSDFEGIQPRYVFRLDITPELDLLFANLHSKTRYNIRLARRKGVQIKENCTREDLRVFYDVLIITAKRDNFLIRSYDYFETLWDCLVENNLAKLFLAEYKGEVIAGTIAFIFGDKTWYIYGASSNKHRNVMPNYLLQWRMIEWAKENGCRIYDFRGVPGRLTPDNPLYGLYRFKKGFMGDYVEFIGEFDLPYSPLVYKTYTAMEAFYSGPVKKLIRLYKKTKNTGGA